MLFLTCNFLLVSQVVKVANLGSCDKTKVKVANPGSESESCDEMNSQVI